MWQDLAEVYDTRCTEWDPVASHTKLVLVLTVYHECVKSDNQLQTAITHRICVIERSVLHLQLSILSTRPDRL